MRADPMEPIASGCYSRPSAAGAMSNRGNQLFERSSFLRTQPFQTFWTPGRDLKIQFARLVPSSSDQREMFQVIQIRVRNTIFPSAVFYPVPTVSLMISAADDLAIRGQEDVYFLSCFAASTMAFSVGISFSSGAELLKVRMYA